MQSLWSHNRQLTELCAPTAKQLGLLSPLIRLAVCPTGRCQRCTATMVKTSNCLHTIFVNAMASGYDLSSGATVVTPCLKPSTVRAAT
jgi:hypothetical protein